MVKVGDKVRITTYLYGAPAGEVVTVTNVNSSGAIDYEGAYFNNGDDEITTWVAGAGTYEVIDSVNHPAHYGGEDDPYEVIKVAEAWGLDKDAYLFNTLKYIARAGKKNADTLLEDLKKGDFYLDRRIAQLEGAND